ncbi:MAG: YegS/Rv2252/BmrU family lipid kinase [Clostridia bacterium]|nr:YegS/Rv2252/BmrU family lipid kinase [Clostridia bacterium]
MKHFFIMNPAAGKGTKFHDLIDEIHKVCDRRQVYYAVHITERQGESTEFVRKMCQSSNEPMRFYACGGDGTIKEVASGLVGFNHAELGIIPMGTGNDFVRNFEHPEQFFNIDAQLDGETRKMDLLKYNDKYAVNLINTGFDCEVAKQVSLNRRSLFVPSKLAYTAGIVQKITQFDSAIVNGRVYIDGVPLKGDKFQACVFANGRFYGAGYRAAPAASFNDGIIDCCIIDKIPLMTFIKILGYYKAGTHLTEKGIPDVFAYKKCKNAELVFYRPTDISVDGEIERVKGKVTFSVAKDAVTLSTPKACQPISTDPVVLRAARRFQNKR